MIKYFKENLDDNTDTQLSALAYIFSVLSTTSKARLTIFERLQKICRKNERSFLLYTYFEKIQSILPWATMTIKEKAELMKDILEDIVESDSDTNLFGQTKSYLDVFKGESKEVIAEYKDHIVEAIVRIFAKDQFLFDLTELMVQPHVKEVLNLVPELNKLYESLQNADQSKASAVFKECKDLLKKSEIGEEDLRTKILYSKLIEISENAKKMTFSELSSSLGCDESEVEMLLIGASEHGFLDAVIDQATNVVYFGVIHKRSLSQDKTNKITEKIDEVIKFFETFE